MNYILDNNRPAIAEQPVRRAALIRLDSDVMFVSHMHFSWLKHLSTEFTVEQRTDR